MSGQPAHALGGTDYPRLLPVGDAALTVEFGDAIAPEIHARVTSLDLALAAYELPGITETVPTYRSLLICYEPTELEFGALVEAVRRLLDAGPTEATGQGRSWRIPVLYGASYGEDLDDVAQRCGISSDDVVAAHVSVEFLVYLVGFAPGVPNLGRLPYCLHLPRRSAPRPMIPAGSVVIAGAQASIVSMPVPSGWHVLGRTPVRLYEPERDDPFLFRPGDKVRFFAIDGVAFDRLTSAAAKGEATVVPQET